MNNHDRIVVIGAGASGLIAAGRAAQLGKEVLLLEKMPAPGRKILLSGNTRCNLTNSRSLEQFIPMYGRNGNFLYSAFKHFFRPELLQLLRKHGVDTAHEPDGRIFPSSNRSSDVVQGLKRFAAESGAKLITGSRVTGISMQEGTITGINLESDYYPASAVIIATGGASYPQTGSSGDGYTLAGSAGHTLVKLRPSLVPLVFKEKEPLKKLQGVSLQDVRLTSFSCLSSEIKTAVLPRHDAGRGLPGKKPKSPVIESRSGSIVFTHFGISGPAALLMSLAVARAIEESPVSLSIDLLPNKTADQADTFLQELFAQHGLRSIRNIISEIVIERIADFILEEAEIDAAAKACRISAPQRRSVAMTIKSLKTDIAGTRPLSEAMVTAGGVCLDEIDPRTMQSKLVKGLYFCGEVMDIDADTGGFNLQAAFSTGYLAGESAASSLT